MCTYIHTKDLNLKLEEWCDSNWSNNLWFFQNLSITYAFKANTLNYVNSLISTQLNSILPFIYVQIKLNFNNIYSLIYLKFLIHFPKYKIIQSYHLYRHMYVYIYNLNKNLKTYIYTDFNIMSWDILPCFLTLDLKLEVSRFWSLCLKTMNCVLRPWTEFDWFKFDVLCLETISWRLET